MWLLCLIISLVGLTIFSIYIFKLKGQRGNKNKIVLILTGFVWIGFGVLFMWMTRPWWHWLWFGVFYMNPTFWIFTTVIILGMRLLYWLRIKRRFILTGMGLWIILTVSLLVLGPAITKVKIYHSIIPITQRISLLPETIKVRYLPLEIALQYGENKIQESEIKLGDIDPIVFDDKFSWVAARVPNGFWRGLSYKSDGFALIGSDGSVKMLRQQMEYGEGMYITDNILWKLRERKYWIEIPEIYYLLNGEEIVGIAPYLSYKFEFPVRIPRWGGVFIFHSDGRIEDFTPEQARQLPYIQEQRIFPESLTRLYVESWAYQNGIWNAWFTHRDQIQIPRIKYSTNQMPFLIPTAEGSMWMVATEPWGKAYGIFKIFWVDTNTGNIQLYELPRETALIGPNRIWDYIKTAYPTYDWYILTSKGSTGNILAIEPRPVIKQSKLYWMASLTNLQYGGVSATFLVDAQNPTNILSFKTEKDLEDFIAGTEYIGSEGITTPAEPISSEIRDRFQKIKELQREIEREIEGLEKLITK